MRLFYLKFSFVFLFLCYLLSLNVFGATTPSNTTLDRIVKDRVKDRTNPNKARLEKGGKNDVSKRDDVFPSTSKNKRKSSLLFKSFKKDNLREKTELSIISTSKDIQYFTTAFESKPVLGPDPFRFSISTSKDSVRVGEEFELTVTVDWVDFGINNGVMFLPEWYKYVLKVAMPKGFVQTGGDYTDYCTKTIDAQNPKAIFTIKGRFESVSQESTFKVLRGFEGAGDASEFIFKGEVSLILKENNIQAKNGKLKNEPKIPSSSSKVAGCSLVTPRISIGLGQGSNISYAITSQDSLYFILGQKIVLTSDYCPGIIRWSNGAVGNQVVVYPLVTTIYTMYCQTDSCTSANSKAVKVIKTTDCNKAYIGRPNVDYSGITKNIFINSGDSITLENKYNCTLYNSLTEYSDGTSIFPGGSRFAPTQNTKYSVRCKNGMCVSTTDTLNVLVKCGNVTTPTLTYFNGGDSEFPIHYVQANGCTGVIKWYNGNSSILEYLGTGNRILLADVPGNYFNNPIATCIVNNCASNLSDSFNYYSLIPFDPHIDYPQTIFPSINKPIYEIIKTACGESLIVNTSGCRSDKPKEIYIISKEGNLTNRVTTYRFEGTSVKIPIPINPSFSITQNTIFLECYAINNSKPTWIGLPNYFQYIQSMRDSTYKVTIKATNNTICTGGTGVLYAENCGGTVQWQNRIITGSWANNATGDTISVGPTVKTFYRAKCISTLCPNNPWSDSLSINIDPLLTAPDRPQRPYSYRPNYLYGDTLVNYSEDPFRPNGMQLQSSCNGTVVWSTGQEGFSAFVNPKVTTVYTTRCRANGCLSQPSQPLIVNVCNSLLPVVTLSKDTVNWCGDRNVTITVTGCPNSYYYGYSYDENGIATGIFNVDSVYTTYFGESTKFRVKCFSKSVGGCASPLSDLKTLYFVGPPKPIIKSNGREQTYLGRVSETDFCELQPINLRIDNCPGIVKWYTVSNTTGYLKYEGTGTTITFPNLPFAPGVVFRFTDNYAATCTVNNCESDRGNFSAFVFKAPTPVISTVSSNQVCNGANLSILSTSCNNNGDGVVVLNGITGSENVNISISKDTTFTAKCRLDYYGCISPNSNTLSFTVKPTPLQLTVSPTTLTICPGDTATLTASACVGYVQWSNGVNGQILKVVPSATTSYTAKCINSCAVAGPNSSPTTVTIQPLAKPVISALKSLLCSNGAHLDGTITLTATGCAYTVQWSNGLL